MVTSRIPEGENWNLQVTIIVISVCFSWAFNLMMLKLHEQIMFV